MSETINQRVARCRKLADLTQTQVAEKMGMKCSTYSQMERRGNISAQRLLVLAEILGVEPDLLFYGEENCPEKTDEVANEEKRPVTLKQVPFYKQKDFSSVFIASKKEENIIKIIRNLPKNARDEVIAYIEQRYKETK